MPQRKKKTKLNIRFGPAGKPLGFKKDIINVPSYLHEIGLNALEIQQVRQINIKKDKALEIRNAGKENDVLLSLHAPYAINFSSEKENVIEASKQRLIKALEVAHWLDAYIVVFHPGYYGSRKPREALEIAIEAIKDVARIAKKKRLKPLIGPETMGKKSQLGSLDEVIEIVKEIPNSKPVLDLPHIHAREGGILNTRKDYEKIFEKLEEELGRKAFNPLHIHFTKIEYSEKGERRHHTFGEGYGPKFVPLAEILVEQKLKATIISESPILEQDAIKMKKIIENILKGKNKKNLEKLE